MGENSKSEVIDIKIKDEEKVKIENIELKAMYTPGHTDCSYSYCEMIEYLQAIHF